MFTAVLVESMYIVPFVASIRLRTKRHVVAALSHIIGTDNTLLFTDRVRNARHNKMPSRTRRRFLTKTHETACICAVLATINYRRRKGIG